MIMHIFWKRKWCLFMHLGQFSDSPFIAKIKYQHAYTYVAIFSFYTNFLLFCQQNLFTASIYSPQTSFIEKRYILLHALIIINQIQKNILSIISITFPNSCFRDLTKSWKCLWHPLSICTRRKRLCLRSECR